MLSELTKVIIAGDIEYINRDMITKIVVKKCQLSLEVIKPT